MTKLVCSNCKKAYEESKNGKCTACNMELIIIYEFSNSDTYLKRETSLWGF